MRIPNPASSLPYLAALALTLSAGACDDNKEDKAAAAGDKDGKDAESPAEADAEKKKSESAEAEPDEDAPAKDESEDDDGGEIDVDALLAAKESASGVLSNADLDGIDTSRAPALGKDIAEQSAEIAKAQWLALPGNTLEIPQPPGWAKKKQGNVGVLIAPDEKALIIFTTVNDQAQVAQAIDDVAKLANITSAKWKEPKQVKLGPDGLGALVRAAEIAVNTGETGMLLFAVVDTGTDDKVLAIALGEDGGSKKTEKEGQNVLLSIRRKRPG
jgi:hypothetical protein